MKLFFKITFFIFFLIFVASLATYPFYREKLAEDIRQKLSSELSELTGHSVKIGSINYAPLQSVRLNNITITDPEISKDPFVSAKNAILTIDIHSLIKHKQLKTTIKIDHLSSKKISCNAVIRTTSSSADTYKGIFDPSLLNSVSILAAELNAPNMEIKNILGILDINDMSISRGKIHFGYHNRSYLMNFTPSFGKNNSFNISLESDHISCRTVLTKDNSTLLLKNMTGRFYAITFDLSGKLDGFLTKTTDLSITGSLKTELKDLTTLPDPIGTFFKKVPLSGEIISKFSLSSKYLDIKKAAIDCSVLAENLQIGKVHIAELLSELSVKNEQLKAPYISGIFYNGKLKSGLTIDLTEKDMPFSLALNIKKMDLEKLMLDLSENESSLFGTVYADLDLKGNAKNSDTFTGNLDIDISDADLGPMPILAPLFGNIYAAIRDNVIPETERIKIDQAYGEFTINDEKLSTDNAILWGKDIAIVGTGHMDFGGNIDFTLQNRLTQNPLKEPQSWQTVLRNTFVMFGQNLGKARMRGTVIKPKWEFDYFPKEKN